MRRAVRDDVGRGHDLRNVVAVAHEGHGITDTSSAGRRRMRRAYRRWCSPSRSGPTITKRVGGNESSTFGIARISTSWPLSSTSFATSTTTGHVVDPRPLAPDHRAVDVGAERRRIGARVVDHRHLPRVDALIGNTSRRTESDTATISLGQRRHDPREHLREAAGATPRVRAHVPDARHPRDPRGDPPVHVEDLVDVDERDALPTDDPREPAGAARRLHDVAQIVC